MVYSDKDLKKIIKEKKLGLTPVLKSDQIGPASIDLRLSDDFKVFRADKFSLLDTKKPLPDHFMQNIKLKKNEPFIIHPGSFILASTVEYIKVPDDIVVNVEGKSSLARMGILVHTAGFVDPGFEGTITLEISNQSNIAVALYAGMYICQIAVSPLTTPAENPYNKRKKSLYMHQRGPTMTDTKNLFKNN